MDNFKGPRIPILFLLHANNNEPINGAIRLQKMVFILKEEHKISKRTFTSIIFKPHKFGMYSPKIQDDLMFLKNLNLVVDDSTDEFDLDFIASEEDEIYKPKKYSLTVQGVAFVKKVISDAMGKDPKTIEAVLKACEEVKSKFNSTDIKDLLRYVYQKYPKYTVKSEILSKILGTSK